MNYNERLAEMMIRKEDKTYRETAEIIKKCPIDVYAFYQVHKRPPRLPDPNYNIKAIKKGIEQLEKELKEEKTDLTSLILV